MRPFARRLPGGPPKLLHVAVLLTAAACTAAPTKVAADPKTGLSRPLDRLEAIGLLKARRFDELSRRIGALQREFESGRRSAGAANAAFWAFAYADPAIERLLDEWVTLDRETYVALLARGAFHSHLGWLARGGEYRSKTARRQFDEMQRHFATALRDTRAALAFNPRLANGYSTLIGIHAAQGASDQARRVFEEAEDNVPRAAEHISTMAHFSGREWTGSPIALAVLLARARTARDKDPRWRSLDGYRAYRKGQKLYFDKDYAAAVAELNRAVSARPGSTTYLLFRARSHLALKRLAVARADVARAIEVAPEDTEALILMARLHELDKDYATALGFAERAVVLDPYDPNLLLLRARLYRETKAPHKASADLDRALVFGDYRAEVHAARARHFRRLRQDAAKVKFEWRRAVDLSPGEERYLGDFLEYLFATSDCEAGSVAAAHLRQCLARRTCDHKTVMHYSYFINGISHGARCPYELHYIAKTFDAALTDADRRRVRWEDERARENDTLPPIDREATSPGRAKVRGFVLEGLKLGATIDEVRAARPDIEIHRQYIPTTETLMNAMGRGRTRDGSASLGVVFGPDGRAHTIYTERTMEIASEPHRIEAAMDAVRARLLAAYGEPDRVTTHPVTGRRRFELRQTGADGRNLAVMAVEMGAPVARGRNRGKPVYAVKITFGMADLELASRASDEVNQIVRRMQKARTRR